jgi:hypothetical protein
MCLYGVDRDEFNFLCFYKAPLHNQLSKRIILYPVIYDQKFLIFIFNFLKTMQICTDNRFLGLRQRSEMNNVVIFLINRNLICTELTRGV